MKIQFSVIVFLVYLIKLNCSLDSELMFHISERDGRYRVLERTERILRRPSRRNLQNSTLEFINYRLHHNGRADTPHPVIAFKKLLYGNNGKKKGAKPVLALAVALGTQVLPLLGSILKNGMIIFRFFLTIPTFQLIVPLLITETLIAGIIIGRLIQLRLSTIPETTDTPATTTTMAPPVRGMATLWTGVDMGGNGFQLSGEVGDCIDFPPQADDQVASIDTMDNCLIVCDLAGCGANGGACYMFTSAGYISDLGSFASTISSIQFC